MTESIYQIDKRSVQASFDKAASRYDELAVLQREVAQRLLERLDYIKLKPQRIVDLGCGTGQITHPLVKRFKGAQVIGLDIAPNMLRQARRRDGWWQKAKYIAADIEALPVVDNSVDLLISSLSFQWCNDLDRVFAECRRVLKPGGLLLFTTFGPDTLKELRASWSAVDARDVRHSHVNQFIDMHDIGDALIRNRFADPVMDVEPFTLTYPDVRALMQELKGIGAHNVTAGRARGLMGKAHMRQFEQAYESYRQDGVLPASYEVIYGHGWCPEQEKQRQGADGSIAIPLDQLRK